MMNGWSDVLLLPAKMSFNDWLKVTECMITRWTLVFPIGVALVKKGDVGVFGFLFVAFKHKGTTLGTSYLYPHLEYANFT